METNNTNLANAAIAAVNSLIAYRTELDNEFFSHPDRYDENVRKAFLERYFAITQLADEINHRFNPCEKQCVTLL